MKIDQLTHEMATLRRWRYDRRSEQLDVLQRSLLDESTAGLPRSSADGDACTVFYAIKHAQAGFVERLHAELKKYSIRVSAIYPPDFDDVDPLSAEWHARPDSGAIAKLTTREVNGAILLAIGAPRTNTDTSLTIDLDNIHPD